MAIQIPRWTGRAAIATIVAVLALWLLFAWLHANALRSELMVPRSDSSVFLLTVAGNDGSRVLLDRTEATAREGIWGLESTEGYAQLGAIVRVTDAVVERLITPQTGDMPAGTRVRVDTDAYSGTPREALGVGFETLRSPSEIGPQPYWFIDGRRSTWVIFVHGRGNDRLEESLRITPSLVTQGFPVMAITMRNDVGATPSKSGLRYWGLEEWRDVDAAIESGLRKGAKDFVIVGSGFGASVVSTFLDESDRVDLVRAVVYESPVLAVESIAKAYASKERTPAPIAWLGRRLTALRFGLDWAALDQIARSNEFDVPILLLYGAGDDVVPVEDFEEFSARRPDIVQSHRFEQARHADLWNVDAERYEDTIEKFLLEIVGPE
jgi:hypothetical protein